MPLSNTSRLAVMAALVIAAATLAWGSINREIASYSNYVAGTSVPRWIVDLAACKETGSWTFEADVIVARTERGVVIRAKADDLRSVIHISGADGCHIDGKVIDARHAGDSAMLAFISGEWNL